MRQFDWFLFSIEPNPSLSFVVDGREQHVSVYLPGMRKRGVRVRDETKMPLVDLLRVLDYALEHMPSSQAEADKRNGTNWSGTVVRLLSDYRSAVARRAVEDLVSPLSTSTVDHSRMRLRPRKGLQRRFKTSGN